MQYLGLRSTIQVTLIERTAEDFTLTRAPKDQEESAEFHLSRRRLKFVIIII